MKAADVIVVGGGNAGFSAALSASERGRDVLLLERCSREDSGGNSYFTAGATRISHDGLPDLLDILEPDERYEVTEVPPYPQEEFAADLAKVTAGRNDPALTEVLVTEGADTLRWLVGHGLRYRLMYERQAYTRPDGTYLFWGGLHVGNVNGGVGLIADHEAAAARSGVTVRYGSHVVALVCEAGAVVGVTVMNPDATTTELRADSVILAAGGFEANRDLRERYLGPGWGNAKVRGTAANTGELLLAALEIGAARGGDWTTCHSVAWDAGFPDNEGNRELTNRLTRQSYHLGIVVNAHGERFLDEGADFRNYTYAKYGKEILAQPDSIAFQVFGERQRPLLRPEEYEMPGVTELTSDTVEGLAEKMGVDPSVLAATVRDFNAGIQHDREFDPTILDGRASTVSPPKSNWATAIDGERYYAYPVTCAITFTFGGLKADTFGRVLDESAQPIPGLLVAGEMLGGLFSGNYPGGSGLTAGMVFGRRAGSIA